jgi:hypothetical protein
MSLVHFNSGGVFEMFVMFFQTFGVASLFLNRLTPHHSYWANVGRIGVILALLGLGISGALCGRHDSEFALFAGGTMTLLLIGMTVGNGSIDAIDATPSLGDAETA